MALSRTDYGPYLFDNTGFTPQGTGPFSTGSFTPSANSILVVFVMCGSDDIASESSYIVTGGSLSWNKEVFEAYDFTPGNGAIYQIWTAEVGGSPSSMQVTVTHTGINSYSFGVLVADYTGYDTVDPVGQVDAANATGTTQTITFGGSPASTSAVLGAILVIANNGDGSDTSAAPGANGGVEISDSTSPDSFGRWQLQERTGSTGTTFDWNTTSSVSASFQNRLFGAIEIKAAAVAGVPFLPLLGVGA